MPVIRINALDGRAVLHSTSGCPRNALRDVSESNGPIIIMTHGFKYSPLQSNTCPHRHFLAQRPTPGPWHCPSWLQHLGFDSGFDDEGVAIAFGWHAHGPLWAARRRAISAGRALAALIHDLRRMNPDRPIHFIGHSLGAELVFEALHHLPPNAIQRIITLTGAAYQSRVLNALQTGAGQSADFINITSRENDLFDFFYECLIQPPRRDDRSIGAGLTAPNAVTLQLDCPDTLAHLSQLTVPIGPSQRRICHWSSYTRPGVLRAYNALLRNRDQLSLSDLRSGLPPQPDRRWSRLFALPKPQGLLPFAQKTS